MQWHAPRDWPDDVVAYVEGLACRWSWPVEIRYAFTDAIEAIRHLDDTRFEREIYFWSELTAGGAREGGAYATVVVDDEHVVFRQISRAWWIATDEADPFRTDTLRRSWWKRLEHLTDEALSTPSRQPGLARITAAEFFSRWAACVDDELESHP